MRILILVRHSLPKLTPNQLPSQWELTPDGRASCGLLADRLTDVQPDVVVTSRERKAVETGEILAGRLGIPCFAADNLHEHRREKGRILSKKAFRAQVEAFFQNPGQLVFGLETAQEALDRYRSAVHAVMVKRPERSVVIVSHGTVMALYYGLITGSDPFLFWKRLGIPGFYTVSWPEQVVLSEVLEIATS